MFDPLIPPSAETTSHEKIQAAQSTDRRWVWALRLRAVSTHKISSLTLYYANRGSEAHGTTDTTRAFEIVIALLSDVEGVVTCGPTVSRSFAGSSLRPSWSAHGNQEVELDLHKFDVDFPLLAGESFLLNRNSPPRYFRGELDD